MRQTSLAGLLGLGLQDGDLASRPAPALPGRPGAASSSSRCRGLGRNRVTWLVLRLDTVALARAGCWPVRTGVPLEPDVVLWLCQQHACELAGGLVMHCCQG